MLSDRRPSTIRALAQCERMLGSWDDAIALYREFLTTGPSAAERSAAEASLAETERARADARPADDPQERRDDPLSWGEEPTRLDPAGLDPTRLGPALSIPPRPADEEPHLDGTAPPPEPEGSLVSSPLFWVVAGVVVAGSAIALFTVLPGDTDEPYGGSLGRVLRR